MLEVQRSYLYRCENLEDLNHTGRYLDDDDVDVDVDVDDDDDFLDEDNLIEYFGG